MVASSFHIQLRVIEGRELDGACQPLATVVHRFIVATIPHYRVGQNSNLLHMCQKYEMSCSPMLIYIIGPFTMNPKWTKSVQILLRFSLKFPTFYWVEMTILFWSEICTSICFVNNTHFYNRKWELLLEIKVRILSRYINRTLNWISLSLFTTTYTTQF